MFTWAQQNKKGFTIIELLIVIVIIAILAAITLVAYNSVQTKAKNSAIIAAVNQSLKVVEAYGVVNSSYPSYYACLVPDSTGTCSWGGSVATNSTLTSTMATNGTLTGQVPPVENSGNVASGIIYNYNSARTMNGSPAPLVLTYFLLGATTCPVGNITAQTGVTLTSTTNGFSSRTVAGNTVCFASVPNP